MNCLFGVMVAGAAVGNTISHHTYTGMNWVKGRARGKPMVDLTAKVDLDSYSELGLRKPRVLGDRIKVEVMADTGASISIAGMQFARRLGIREDDLLGTTMMIHSADGSKIDVRGSVFVSLTGSGQATKEQVYICRGTKGCLLSLDACIALRVVPGSFPQPGAVGGARPGADIGATSQGGELRDHPERRKTNSSETEEKGIEDGEEDKPEAMKDAKPVCGDGQSQAERQKINSPEE